MSDEMSVQGARKAINFIIDGEFSLALWEGVYLDIDCEQLLSLLSSIRNALSYGVENKKIKGIVKHGFLYSMKSWDLSRDKISTNVAVAGDMAIAEANKFIKKRAITVE